MKPVVSDFDAFMLGCTVAYVESSAGLNCLGFLCWLQGVGNALCGHVEESDRITRELFGDFIVRRRISF